MKQYDPTLQKVTQFFTNWDPAALLQEITKNLKQNDIPFKISDKTYKVTFSKERKVGDDEPDAEKENTAITVSAHMQVKLLDAGKNIVCVQFTRKGGSAMMFYNSFNQLKDQLELCNNVSM